MGEGGGDDEGKVSSSWADVAVWLVSGAAVEGSGDALRSAKLSNDLLAGGRPAGVRARAGETSCGRNVTRCCQAPGNACDP